MEGRQQALTFFESGEQERTLRGQEFASKDWIAVVLIGESAATEVVRRMERPIARVMEGSSFMVACYRDGYRLLYVVMQARKENLEREKMKDAKSYFVGRRKKRDGNQPGDGFMQIRWTFFLSFSVG